MCEERVPTIIQIANTDRDEIAFTTHESVLRQTQHVS